MSELSKNELKYENSVSFPNNNSGEISPADLRNFNVSIIDSTVNQTQYNSDSSSFDGRLNSVEDSVTNLNSYTASTDIRLDSLESSVDQLEVASSSFEAKFNEIQIQSASWGGYATGSFLTTSSFEFYTESNNQRVDSLEIATASLQNFTSSQEAINTNLELATASLESSVLNLNGFTQSQELLNSTFATTGSNTFFGNQTVNGEDKQTFESPADFTQIDLITVNNVNVTGTPFNVATVGFQDYGGSAFQDIFAVDFADSFSYNYYNSFYINGKATTFNLSPSGSGGGVQGTMRMRPNIADPTLVDTSIWGNNLYLASNTLPITMYSPEGVIVSSSVDIEATLTASLQEGHMFIGDSNGRTISVSTSSVETNISRLVLTSSFNEFTQSQENLNATFATTGSNSFIGNQIVANGGVTASLLYSEGDLTANGATYLNGQLHVQGQTFRSANVNHNVDDAGYAQYIMNPDFYSTYYGTTLLWTPNQLGGGQSRLFLSEKFKTFAEINAWSGAYDNKVRIQVDENGVKFNDWDLPSYGESTWLSIQQSGTPTFQRGLAISGSVSTSGSVSGNVSPITISDNTASLDFGSANFFTLTLVSGEDTRIEASNVQTGQTVNLKIEQPGVGVGTVSYPSEFKFPEVAPYSASILESSVDIITFVTFDDTSSIYSAAVKRLV